MQTLLNTLDKHLQEKRPDYYKDLRPPLTDQQIGDLEKKYNLQLPSDVRLLYQWKNGQDDYKRFVNNSTFMPLESALESYELLTGMIGYDFEIKNWWNEHWIPLFENGSGDHICVDMAGIFTGDAGQIVDFWHDSPGRNVTAPSLEAFIGSLNKYYETTKPEDFDEFFIIEGIKGYPKRFEVK
ncbi:SMI1/KNR4 family protein [Fulvivirgaceae bacterium PWU4]|uniref:SMI1/KNR4 family protein n=1 Tax=Chryseosolibacter histidini TaxID=2782349 RepID=A0AAP2DMN0_9BACT|nr:SMI1/KNR4 family protein [Chryseosolibacter histidini]MBT1699165.1 SMI1/KNR4 family protein [Chryseosolibacter histidini]